MPSSPSCCLLDWRVHNPGSENAQPESGTFIARNTEFVRYRLTPPNGPEIEYFISKPKKPSPLVLFVQGSGCIPVFTGLGTP